MSGPGKASDIDSAQSLCGQYGGYLAEIEDDAELKFVTKFARKYTARDTDYVFIGSKSPSKNEWRYMTSGGVMDMAKFNEACSGDGGDCNGGSNVVCLTLKKQDKLNDDPCDIASSEYFLCEIPLK